MKRRIARRVSARAAGPALIGALVLVLVGEVAGEEAQRRVQLSVDPRVELMSIVFRLAGNPEYKQGGVPAYSAAVREQFGPFEDHEVVRLARGLRRDRGVSFDAVMSLAVHMTPELEEALPFDPLPAGLDRRWRLEDTRSFRGALKRFAADSRFEAFFEQHGAFYGREVERLAELIESEGRLGWFDRFFGAKPATTFTVVVALLTAPNAYGPRVDYGDGREDIYCIFPSGADEGSGPAAGAGALPFIVHEFCHSYVNPLVFANEEALRPAGELLYPHVAAAMKLHNYGNWTTVMHESIVRAAVIRYLLATQGKERAEEEAREQVKLRFHWTPDLARLMGEYESNRDRHPAFRDFFPAIIEFMNKNAARFAGDMIAQEAAKPRIVSIAPRNGSVDVDPSVGLIRVTFDRPMKSSYSFVGGGPRFPETKAKPAWDETGATVSLPVALKPRWEYEFWLNRGEFLNFRASNGVPLEPVHVRFRTGDQ